MTFHTPNLTPRAFDAIVSQMAGRGHYEAEFDGWTAFFETECYQRWDNENHYLRNAEPLTATLVGTWREDEDGNLFAGNRAEVAALVGEAEVLRWEAYVEGVAA